jgi:hypothetical protein
MGAMSGVRGIKDKFNFEERKGNNMERGNRSNISIETILAR